MSGIFGIFHRDNTPVDLDAIQRMQKEMAYWGPDGIDTWYSGCAALGQSQLYDTPESTFERLPSWYPENKIAFTAEARVDNRKQLLDIFNIPYTERQYTPDSDLILRAYLKWGQDCPDQLLGDWAFAVWHPNEKKLFLARDHLGNTSLYTYITNHLFAFASCKQALLALPQISSDINELRLAQILTAWSGNGKQTIFKNVQRLPPAHVMVVTPENQTQQQYWYLENTDVIERKTLKDYIIGFLEIYTEAIQCRLRSHKPVGVTLSGGLDSCSLTALAGRILATHNLRLTAFTAVPLYDVRSLFNSQYISNEYPLAHDTAEFVGNVDLFQTNAVNMSPVTGIKRSLDIHKTPVHSAANAYWLIDLLHSAKEAGIGVLLTGQGGNATISWPGSVTSQNIKNLLKHGLIFSAIKQLLINPYIPVQLHRLYKTWKVSRSWKIHSQPYLAYSAINPRFAQDLNLTELMLESGHDPYYIAKNLSPQQRRYEMIGPGRSITGSIWAENGAAFEMATRDPTLDKRLVTYCLSIPDRLFIDHEGRDRAIIRESMIGLLPDNVRLNKKRGLQAADVGYRIVKHKDEMKVVLDTFEKDEYIKYCLDLQRMYQIYNTLLDKVDMNTTRESVSILLRGLMAGLFIMQNLT